MLLILVSFFYRIPHCLGPSHRSTLPHGPRVFNKLSEGRLLQENSIFEHLGSAFSESMASTVCHIYFIFATLMLIFMAVVLRFPTLPFHFSTLVLLYSLAAHHSYILSISPHLLDTLELNLMFEHPGITCKWHSAQTAPGWHSAQYVRFILILWSCC